MERSKVEKMKRLFNTALYLVEAERPFRDFPALLQLQGLNSQPYGPRQRAQPESETDSSDSESDLDP